MATGAILIRRALLAGLLIGLALAGGGARAEVILTGPEGMQRSMTRLAPLVSARTGIKLRIIPGEERILLSKIAQGNIPFAILCRHVGDAESAAVETHLLGHDGVAVIVNGRNPVTGLSSLQLKDIYAQRLASWREAGGAAKPIVRVVKDTRALPAVAARWLPALSSRPAPGTHVVNDDLPAILFVAVDPYAIGYVGVAEATRLIQEGARVRAIAIDGNLPTPAHLRSGAYPIAWPVQLVSARKLSEAELRLQAFLLTPEGRRALAEAGVLVAEEEGP
ncbi:MAG: substrate-binding domain-containing protein [Gammaproteobacteria bacterium]